MQNLGNENNFLIKITKALGLVIFGIGILLLLYKYPLCGETFDKFCPSNGFLAFLIALILYIGLRLIILIGMFNLIDILLEYRNKR